MCRSDPGSRASAPRILRSARSSLASGARRTLRKLGLQPVVKGELPLDIDARTASILQAVRPYTMTSPERVMALCDAIRHLHRCQVPGDIVECGVWRGGSVMAAAFALLDLGSTERTLHLFDTFEGMPLPTEPDVDHHGRSAAEWFPHNPDGTLAPGAVGLLDPSPLQEVRRNLATTGYPPERVRFLPGRVEETLPDQAPDCIALLRLDTDWYESTRHELVHLYPRLAPGGVLIIDDYGHWDGARRAVDEYFDALPEPPMLIRVDYTCRLAVVPAGGVRPAHPPCHRA